MMNSIPELYSLQTSMVTGGIEGYHVQKKYYDPLKMKQQRLLSQSNQKPKQNKPANLSQKTTFIDAVVKKQSKLPGPTTYQPVDVGKSKIKPDTVTHPVRETFIDQITKIAKKRGVPGAGTYGKIEVDVDKQRLKSNLSKAQSPTYAEACMRKSLDAPGVGEYNAYRAVLDHRGSKWVADPEKSKKKHSPVKLPSVGSYNPNPVEYKLFSSVAGKNRKSSNGFGGKTQRFPDSKEKKIPYYSVLSEWGMKGKLQKKDILYKISSHPSVSRSVYY